MNHMSTRHPLPTRARHSVRAVACAVLLIACAGFIAGCQTGDRQAVYSQPPELPAAVTTAMAERATNVSQSIILREGDVLRIIFPSAPNLSTVQPIRRDGKITLQLVGEITAAGLTPTQLQEEILKRYADQLLTKEVSVSVESSAFPVFVTGAVIRPGKILVDRQINVLEAVMEAGGFDYSKANTKNVLVIRNENGVMKNFRVNLKAALEGKTSELLIVKPSDIIYVPEKFQWF
jgi:polysaccharide export outer membrane protein